MRVMLSIRGLRIAVLLLWCLAGDMVVASELSNEQGAPGLRKAVSWTNIKYPGVAMPSLTEDKLFLSIEPTVPAFQVSRDEVLKEKKQDLAFTVKLTWNGGEDRAKELCEAGLMIVRLHYPDGRIVEPKGKPLRIVVATGNIFTINDYAFPYGDNSLTEAWLEVRVESQLYWFEIPYGFTRNPEAPLPPSDPKAELVGFAPAMKDSPKNAESVRWSAIQYDSGTIQDGMKLEVDLINRGDIRCVTRLRRENGQLNIHSPLTKVVVVMDNGGKLIGEQVASVLPKKHVREDEFNFHFEPLAGRGWGNLVVTVDDKPWSGVISLGPFLQGMLVDPWRR